MDSYLKTGVMTKILDVINISLSVLVYCRWPFSSGSVISKIPKFLTEVTYLSNTIG